jgi:PhnB protein
MASVNVYLNFNGNCEEAFIFYKSVFGGEFQYIGRFNEMPPSEHTDKMTVTDGEKIMHVSLPVGKETVLMGSDTGGEWAPGFLPGNNFSMSINTDSKEEAEKLFKGLSNGGKVTMPLNKTFWSDCFGMFTDKFGINWMVSFDGNQQK